MKRIMLLIGLLLPLWVSANPVPDFPFVIVTESIEQDVKPDTATISFSILAYDPSSDKAMNQLTKTSADMLEILRKYDVPVASLESDQVNKTTKRARRDGAFNLEILGYEVQQRFTLRLTQLEVFPGLMNDLVRTDGVQNVNAGFETSREDEYKAAMIAALSDKARKKADTLAEAQSRKVKAVYGITTEGNFGQAYAIFSLQYNPQAYAMASKMESYGMELVMAVPESIKIGQRITAIYELK